MFGENDLVDNLSRDLDRVRGKRDALASDVTTLTAQIAEIEARLAEERKRRERNHVLGEIEAIKKRIIRAASAFAPVVGELCEATEMAAAVVPEARELNSFLLSVATEVDTLIDPLLRELDRRADAVRVGHAALDLPCLANESPTELPRDKSDRLLRFLSRNKEVGKKETAENPRSTAAWSTARWPACWEVPTACGPNGPCRSCTSLPVSGSVPISRFIGSLPSAPSRLRV